MASKQASESKYGFSGLADNPSNGGSCTNDKKPPHLSNLSDDLIARRHHYPVNTSYSWKPAHYVPSPLGPGRHPSDRIEEDSSYPGFDDIDLSDAGPDPNSLRRPPAGLDMYNPTTRELEINPAESSMLLKPAPPVSSSFRSRFSSNAQACQTLSNYKLEPVPYTMDIPGFESSYEDEEGNSIEQEVRLMNRLSPDTFVPVVGVYTTWSQLL
ncbi:hypothetical protein FA15DRAFT_705344 [Coprinopsis marcescibilis]|uniref:Uncharacterized protein n=1 Tax=Coprinopsis marcescibilis TaxID=230819 RepID=A0A5C3KSG8_COPMA|nr:hypothetical protein FA15DRAFT_705344 [Coprinopsis marcescibilis]